jgi:hypothetical protein
MAATPQGAILGQFFGTSWANAFGPGASGFDSNSLDIFQIIDHSGSVLVNVDSTGAVHKPAVSATTDDSGLPKTRLGAFYTRLTSAATLAQIIADVFSNPSSLDLVQIIQQGGNIVNWIDSAGVSH